MKRETKKKKKKKKKKKEQILTGLTDSPADERFERFFACLDFTLGRAFEHLSVWRFERALTRQFAMGTPMEKILRVGWGCVAMVRLKVRIEEELVTLRLGAL
jgi:hypothetical protein